MLTFAYKTSIVDLTTLGAELFMLPHYKSSHSRTMLLLRIIYQKKFYFSTKMHFYTGKIEDEHNNLEKMAEILWVEISIKKELFNLSQNVM